MIDTSEAKAERQWIVYLLTCADGTYYTGITKDLNRRLAAHQTGKAARYTRSRLPVKLFAYSQQMEHGQALRLERQIKQMPRPKKATALPRCSSSDFATPPHKRMDMD